MPGPPPPDPATLLKVAGNLSDVASASTSRTNLGLGSVLNSKQVTSIALTTPSVVYATPVTFSVDAAGAATATLALNTQAHGADPAAALWGVAVAPYAPIVPTLAPDDWRVNLLAGPHVSSFYALAKQYGLRSCAYEAGVDVSGNSDVAAQSDPRMGPLLSRYLSKWGGTGPLMYYRNCAEAAVAYGLTTDANDLGQPKFRAAASYASSLAPH